MKVGGPPRYFPISLAVETTGQVYRLIQSAYIWTLPFVMSLSQFKSHYYFEPAFNGESLPLGGRKRGPFKSTSLQSHCTEINVKRLVRVNRTLMIELCQESGKGYVLGIYEYFQHFDWQSLIHNMDSQLAKHFNMVLLII